MSDQIIERMIENRKKADYVCTGCGAGVDGNGNGAHYNDCEHGYRDGASASTWTVERFLRSALFPLLLVVIVVYIASQTVGHG